MRFLILLAVFTFTGASTFAASNESSDMLSDIWGTSFGNSASELKCDAHFQRSGSCVTVVWEKRPTETDYGSFVFKVTKPANEGVLAADTMNVRAFMPGMGNGSTQILVKKLDSTSFRASNVYFSMRGDWQLIFEVKNLGQVIDSAVLPYKF